MGINKSLSILVVDDNQDHVDLLKDELYKFNIENNVYCVGDGEKAISFLRGLPPFDDRVKNPRPDVVFLDLRMPRQEGITTLKIIKNDPELAPIPVIVVSTSRTSKEVDDSFQQGACGFFTKPIQLEEFSRLLKTLNIT